MKKVLIISKTKMYNGACIGGIIVPDLTSVRLLNHDRTYHTVDTEFNIGQLWEMELKAPPKLIKPHVEDVLVQSKKFIKDVTAFDQLIEDKELRKIVWKGHPKNLFQGLLAWTGNRHGFIGDKSNVPEMSTGFWLPDKNLTFDGKYYIYDDGKGNYDSTFGLKYVGFEKAIDTIPRNTRVRVSLAKWWHPKDIEIEDRCYLQLSGWYKT